MKVIMNSDDFGITEGVNNGIIQAHQKGIIRRATLLMNGSAVNHAVTSAKENPTLKVGIHLTLSFGKPLNKALKRLINERGDFKFTKFETTLTQDEQEEVELEWTTQIEAFLKTGLTLDHIDSHHHVHGWPCLSDVVKRLHKRYNVPVRFVDSLADTPAMLLTPALFLDFYDTQAGPDLFIQLEKQHVPLIEVMTHPGYSCEQLMQLSSYAKQRDNELALLMSLTVPHHIELI